LVVGITAEVAGVDDEEESRSLRAWLLRESDPAVRVITAGRETGPETLGATAETLQVALGTGGAATVLATSVAVWIKTRRPRVRLRLRRPDGAELVLDGEVTNPERVIEGFLEVIDRGD
jgi:Effector Associated Constant Component 1